MKLSISALTLFISAASAFVAPRTSTTTQHFQSSLCMSTSSEDDRRAFVSKVCLCIHVFDTLYLSILH